MNLIELHIIQSFPVTCLNRDDLGSPKSAIFGGVKRARISSQCLKRPTREYAHENAPDLFAGIRSKLVGPAVEKAAKKIGCDDSRAAAYAKIVVASLGKGKVQDEVSTLLYFSPGTLKNVVTKLDEGKQITDEMVNAVNDANAKSAEKALNKAVDAAKGILKGLGDVVSDAADIALFGRMVADDASRTVEGAAMFSHALSTHAVSSEIDFFSAVDDLKKGAEDAGAGHIGTTEFNSACYYRYVGINLDLLKESRLFDQAELKSVLENFIRAVVMANPVARRNAMFGYTLPACVLGLRRKGQPLSLANAFEEPVKGSAGLVAESAAKMKSEWDSLKVTFGLDEIVRVEVEKGGATLDELIQKLTDGLA